MKTWLIDKCKEFSCDILKLHKSITVWFNAVLASIAFALPELISFVPSLKDYIPEDNYKLLMAICLVGNFLIRFRTTKALRDK